MRSPARRTGTPSVVMVLGVSGVGKTRLVTEFGDQARARDMRVLVGNCLELTTGDLPLGPVATILRDLIRTVGQDRVATVLGGARDELARLVPALGSSERPRRSPTTRGPAMIPTSTGVRRSRGCSTSCSTR